MYIIFNVISFVCEFMKKKPKNTTNYYYYVKDNSVMKNRFRLGGIEYVPVGESNFSFRISVPSVQPAPLRLEQFKASGFASKVRRFQAWDRSIDE